jgi:hypothetical protein
MATVALIGNSFGNAIDTDNVAGTYVNQSSARPTTAGITLTNSNHLENKVCGTITAVYNGTTKAQVINSGNYTQTGCVITNKTDVSGWTANWLYSYPYTYSSPTVASNTTDDLQTNVSDNTSIAGIILTISLVGIVLTILIGVFVGVRGGTTRV